MLIQSVTCVADATQNKSFSFGNGVPIPNIIRSGLAQAPIQSIRAGKRKNVETVFTIKKKKKKDEDVFTDFESNLARMLKNLNISRAHYFG